METTPRYTLVEYFAGQAQVSAAFRGRGHLVASYDSDYGEEMNFLSPSGFACLTWMAHVLRSRCSPTLTLRWLLSQEGLLSFPILLDHLGIDGWFQTNLFWDTVYSAKILKSSQEYAMVSLLLRLALALALATVPGGLHVLAPDCSSWTRISRGSSLRSQINVFGNTSSSWVLRGCMMIARCPTCIEIKRLRYFSKPRNRLTLGWG